jgi:radical SAM protein with 4Fe4S-binding SPASM domain
MEREHPELCNWGDMDFKLLEDISRQVPDDIVVQFHNNGEPTLYPQLGKALELFDKNIRCFDTNGKLLLEKLDEIKGNLETITVSVIEKDTEAEDQFKTVCEFIEKKGDEKPSMVYRLNGEVEKSERWEALPGLVVRRILHAPEASRSYTKPVTIPEIGICLDLLNHLVIDRSGNVSPCVRFDPNGMNRLGNVRERRLEDFWTGFRRKEIVRDHIGQHRTSWRLCNDCEYYGIPRG